MNYTKKSANSHLIAELPPHERPRERLLSKGEDALSNVELLAILLRTGRKGKSTLDLAREVLHLYNGNLADLAAATATELSTIKGIGPAKAAELRATFSLAARMATELGVDRRKIQTPEEAAAYIRERFRGRQQEELRVILLNTKNMIIRDELVTVGLLDRSQAHAREVFRPAIQHSAAKLILAHNHPSGDPTPSAQDIRCTRDLAAAGRLIGIDVVDHLIIGTSSATRQSDYVSLRDSGLFDTAM